MKQKHIGTTPYTWLDKVLEKSSQLPRQGTFSIQGLEVAIHAYDPETYSWVEKYLHPLNLANLLDTSLTYSVNLLHSNEIVHSALHAIGSSEVDTSQIFNGRRYLDRILATDDITVDCDPSFGMLWVTDRSKRSITLVLSVKVLWPLLEVSRVVRDLATRYLADQGWAIFHAGAVHVNDKNYVIIGDSGAGKTSFIIALSAAGAAYISNERVFVKVKDGEVHLLCFPMPIAVGLGTMVQYPELIKFIRDPQYLKYPPRRMDADWIHSHPEYKWPELEDKPQFLPQDLTDNFSNIEGVSGGRIDGLIVPSFQKNEPVEIKTLNKNEVLEIIRNNWFDPQADDVYPPWMPLDFAQPSLEDVNSAITGLMELKSIQFQFSADKNRRNEIHTYPELLTNSFNNN